MANLNYPAVLQNAMLDEITTRAGASALLKIYDGSQPATADTAVSGQTLLAELTCNATFAPAASGGVLTLNAISDDTSANASGTATWFRITTSAGTTTVLDGDITTVATGTGDLQLDSTSITATQTVSVSSFTITEGNA